MSELNPDPSLIIDLTSEPLGISVSYADVEFLLESRRTPREAEDILRFFFQKSWINEDILKATLYFIASKGDVLVNNRLFTWKHATQILEDMKGS